MVNFLVLSIDTQARVISVEFRPDCLESSAPSIPTNLHMTGPDAGIVDLQDEEAVLAYLRQYAFDHYEGKKFEVVGDPKRAALKVDDPLYIPLAVRIVPEDHPLVGQTF
jgi:hypothetical protein